MSASTAGPGVGTARPDEGQPALAAPASSYLQRVSWRSVAFEHLPVAGAVLDASGRIVATNATWRLFSALNDGTEAATGEGVDYLDVCARATPPHDVQARAVLTGLRGILDDERTTFSCEYPCPSPHEDRWFLLQATAAPVKDGAGIVLFHVDITSRKAAERRLVHRATHDALTGLGNRSAAHEELTSLLDAAEAPFHVISFDLDGFKAVNDAYGHHVGDQVLVQVAQRVQRIFQPDGSVYRLGGDEFLAVCAAASPTEAERAAAMVRQRLALPFQVGPLSITIGAAAGVVSSTDHPTAGDLLLDADARMYAEKRARHRRHGVRRAEVGTSTVPQVTMPAEGSSLVEAELRAAQATTNAVLAHATDLVLFFDGDGTIVWASPASEKLFGFTPEQLVGRNGMDLVHPDDRERAARDFALVPSVGDTIRTEFRVTTDDGRVRWVEEIVTNLLDDPDVGSVVGHIRDVTDRKVVEDELRLHAERLAEAQATAGLGSFEIDLDTGAVERSDELWRIIGHPGPNPGVALLDAVHPADRSAVEAALHSLLEEAESASLTHRIVRPDGEVRWVASTTRRIDGERRTVMGTCLDITERHLAEQALVHQADHDPLTGLANRRLFVRRLEASLDRNVSTGRRTAVLFIDLDDFKVVNDQVGHGGGDEVLRAVGDLIDSALTPGDTVARFGGDEFVVCCEGVVDADDAMATVERITSALSLPFRHRSETFVVSASIGVVLSRPTSQAEALLRDADAAMYAAKHGSRGVELFDEAMDEQAARRRSLVAELEDAIADGQIQTWFQPELELRTGELIGFEALVRWVHPERGVIGPGDFIELAEDSGLINELGRRVLADACEELARWVDRHPDRYLMVSVNLSPRQMSSPSLVDDIRAAIAGAGVPAGRVCLEITESSLMDPELAADVLRSLKEIGVLIAIDDFGTGYSSLSRLKHFPVDFLKLDRSFVVGLGRDPEDELIVRAIAGLAHSMGIQVIAEGIENDEQATMLADMGCEFGQGHLWGRPMPLPEAQAYAALAGAHPDGSVPVWGAGARGGLPVSWGPKPTSPSDAIALLVHELASPLTVATGYAGILEELPELAGSDLATTAIRAVVKATEDMGSILSALADVRPLEEGTITLDREEVDLVALVEDVIALHCSPSPGAVEVRGDRPVLVHVDPGRVRQIVRNLATNAQKWQRSSTWIDIKVDEARGVVTASVLDDGPGVPAERIGDLFRRFARFDPAQTGTGIGLHLSRALARAHGGDIRYRYRTGGGSEFVLELPLAGAARTALAAGG